MYLITAVHRGQILEIVREWPRVRRTAKLLRELGWVVNVSRAS